MSGIQEDYEEGAWCFVFFQAEDGIRDIGVTGVQTCALPISRAVTGARRRSASAPADRTSRTTAARPRTTRAVGVTARIRPQPPTSDVGGCGQRLGRRVSDRPATEQATIALGEPDPDAEAPAVGQRVLQAVGLDLAAGADLLGLAGRAALLGEEGLGVRLGAERPLLPRLGVGLETDAQQPGDALGGERPVEGGAAVGVHRLHRPARADRKSTRLNSSHANIS